VTVLEATEVDDSDWEQDLHEWVPTVEARLVGGRKVGSASVSA
jgi:hypothetical protein